MEVGKIKFYYGRLAGFFHRNMRKVFPKWNQAALDEASQWAGLTLIPLVAERISIVSSCTLPGYLMMLHPINDHDLLVQEQWKINNICLDEWVYSSAWLTMVQSGVILEESYFRYLKYFHDLDVQWKAGELKGMCELRADVYDDYDLDEQAHITKVKNRLFEIFNSQSITDKPYELL